MAGSFRIRYGEIGAAAVLALVFGYSVFSGMSIPDTARFGGDT